MAKIITRIGIRCMNHPHREAGDRCSRCGHPFCFTCLDQLPGCTDNRAGQQCAPCLVTSLAEEAAAAYARSFRGRLKRVRAVAWALTPGVAALAVLAALAGLSLRYLGPKPAHDTPCGELTRIRSVAAIGLPGPSEAINFLTYPHRASVRLLVPRGPTGDGAGPMGPPLAASGAEADPATLVDECATGWRSAPDVALPVALLLEPRKEGSYVHRLALWQDPQAQRGEWVKDFELLASATEDGDDFVSLHLDRPPVLLSTVEPQWFRVMQPPLPLGVEPWRLPAQERGRYEQQFPDAVPVRRLLVRILSTHGVSRGAVALGEVAAYGPDLEVVVADVLVNGAPSGIFGFGPGVIQALAGRPTFVLFMNQSIHAHSFVTVAQGQNVELHAEPGQAVAGQFVAAGRPGRYEFYCRVPSHDLRGLVGSIIVR